MKKPRCRIHSTPGPRVDNRSRWHLGGRGGGGLAINVTSRQKQQVEDMVEGEVAGSRHTLKQIIMPGRFSTVMKPKVNHDPCFTDLKTCSRAVQRSHSKSC